MSIYERVPSVGLSFLAILLALTCFWSAESLALDISGFIESKYFQRFGGLEENSPREFDVSGLNLLLGHRIDRFSMLAELRWAHSAELEGLNRSETSGTSAKGQGVIMAERAWVGVDLGDMFQIKVGNQLGPAIYQTIHFPSILPNMTKPMMVNNVISDLYNGLNVSGKFQSGAEYELVYATDPMAKDDTLKSNLHKGITYGGRLGYRLTGQRSSLYLGGLMMSYALGRDTTEFDDPTQTPPGIFIQNAREMEGLIKIRDFSLWFEIGDRKDTVNEAFSMQGFYVLMSQSFYFGDIELLPSLVVESFHDRQETLAQINRYSAGITVRFVPDVSLKVEYLLRPSYQKNETDWSEKQDQLGLGLVIFFM